MAELKLNSKEMKKPEISGPGGLLKKHLDLIKKIAQGKVVNSLDETDTSNMTEDEVMRLFVHADKSKNLEKYKRRSKRSGRS